MGRKTETNEVIILDVISYLIVYHSSLSIIICILKTDNYLFVLSKTFCDLCALKIIQLNNFHISIINIFLNLKEISIKRFYDCWNSLVIKYLKNFEGLNLPIILMFHLPKEHSFKIHHVLMEWVSLHLNSFLFINYLLINFFS
jgi:hypothetical protein